MRHFLFRWAITTVAVMVAAALIKGIRYDSLGALVGAALLLGILNAFLRPICSCSWRRLSSSRLVFSSSW